MIEQLRMVNFRSFKDTTISFVGKKGLPKNLAFIYGENGAGKTNIISAFNVLAASTSLMSQNNTMAGFKDGPVASGKNINIPFLKSILALGETNETLANVGMIGSNKPTELEFTFLFKENHFFYRLVLSEKGIEHESLQFNVEKNKTLAFSLDFPEKVFLHPKLITSEKYHSDIIEKCKKYLGKNTLISIFDNELRRNNEKYMQENINPKLLDFVRALDEMTVLCSKKVQNIFEGPFYDFHHSGSFHYPSRLVPGLISGTIPASDRDSLEATQKVLDYFFSGLFSDIKSVKYDITENNNDTISYSLVFNKMIEREIRAIPANNESSGSLKLLSIFPSIMDALDGNMVFIDEIDSGIHDMLMVRLFELIKDKIKGQLIITTHNTLLLNLIKPEQAYVINFFGEAQKEVYSLDHVSPRIQKNHNTMERYLRNFYGGSPEQGFFDPDELLKLFKGKK